ncbi:hypothetical protein NKG94_40540 [Micromonospora sp. M12]
MGAASNVALPKDSSPPLNVAPAKDVAPLNIAPAEDTLPPLNVARQRTPTDRPSHRRGTPAHR